jgi:hypothetical protein
MPIAVYLVYALFSPFKFYCCKFTVVGASNDFLFGRILIDLLSFPVRCEFAKGTKNSSVVRAYRFGLYTLSPAQLLPPGP